MITTALPENAHAPVTGRGGRRSAVRTDDAGAAPSALRSPAIPPLTAAALLEQPSHETVIPAMRWFMSAIGAPLDCLTIPASLATGGTVGRIGVPRDATAIMQRQKVVLGATIGRDPLGPVPRLWRGMQRRGDVQVDVQQCTTLLGSAADHAGIHRDVLLFSQRLVDSAPRRSRAAGGAGADTAAQEWTRARDAADLAYRLAAAEQRNVLLVLPVGRGTETQQYFTDALERQARLHRMAVPRVVKAGLLAAMLSGETGRERWLVASVMPIDELSALAREAIGDTGPWPVISIGRDVTFIDMPSDAGTEPLPLLLALSTLLQRSGRSETARTLLQATLLTSTAVTRMRAELGGELTVPIDAFLQGVLANWGRTAPACVSSRDGRGRAHQPPPVAGLRLRVQTPLTAVAVRDTVAAALQPTGLEVASVRSAETPSPRDQAMYDVRVRSRLGETTLSDMAAEALRRMLSDGMRCVAVEPWTPVSATERLRTRAAS